MARLLTLTLFCLLAMLSSKAQHLKYEIAGKVSVSLSKTMRSLNESDSIDLYLSYTVGDSLSGQFRLLSTYKPGKVSLIRTRVGQLNQLLQSKHVLFADAYVAPKEELTTATLDLATNKVNLAQSLFPTINGEGFLASVKENKLDTTDLDYIGRYVNTGLSATSVTPHASMMATTIAGAGNTSSFAKGVAPAIRLTSSDFASLLPDADAVFKQYGITVQNHSYGTVVQNYYGPEATAYDVSAINNPTLLHVFSSGNSGSAKGTGVYNDIEGVANLTGNFKMAKNILTVGAIDSFYNVSSLSSKGPAYDGRVKPELVAFGEDGSSGAAAMVSGTALLIQQAYQLKLGQVPQSATTKAILVNSADDVGAKGIDFASGYGNLNAYHALKTVQESRFFESTIATTSTKSFQVVVPEKAASLKVTLVWSDPAAPVNASKALVNDIDLLVKAPDNSHWLPWVLNSKASKTALLELPVRKTDTLNTVEQVTIESPIAGTYTIQVSSKALQDATQSFSVAYQIDTSEMLFWTFPAGDDKVEANASTILRWETNSSGSVTLEYSTDKTTWQSITTLPDVRVGYYKWQSPNFTTLAWLRLKTSTGTIVSDTFVISPVPRMDVGFHCADSFLLLWSKLKPGMQYQLYELGDQYMTPFANVADTFSLLKEAQHPAIYYTVAAVINGKTGLRAPVLNYTAQGVTCYFKSFYLQNQIGAMATLFSSLGSIYGVTTIALQKLERNSFTTIQSINQPSTTQFIFEDPTLHQGFNQYRLALQLTNGQTIYSDIVGAYYFNDKSIVVYPNPAKQQQPIHIIASRAGRTAIQIYNSAGVLINEMRLKDLHQELPPLRLNTGLYYIRVIDEETGAISSQKLIVY